MLYYMGRGRMKINFAAIAIIVAIIGAGWYLVKPAGCGAACEEQIISVSASEFEKLTKDKNKMVIDVRTIEEYVAGHIGNAVNSDFNNKTQFNALLNTLNKNGEYLIYCRSGSRSAAAQKLMKEKGFNRVIDLSGGIVAWEEAGLPVVKQQVQP